MCFVRITYRCVAQGVAYFHKQWGGRTPKAGGRLLDGRAWDELPSVPEQLVSRAHINSSDNI
jgi:protein gp37